MRGDVILGTVFLLLSFMSLIFGVWLDGQNQRNAPTVHTGCYDKYGSLIEGDTCEKKDYSNDEKALVIFLMGTSFIFFIAGGTLLNSSKGRADII